MLGQKQRQSTIQLKSAPGLCFNRSVKQEASRHVVLGVDPGSRIAGLGVIAYDPVKGSSVHLFHEALNLGTGSLAQRLYKLSQRIDELITTYQVSHLSLEQAFFGKNADSAFKIGMSRGVCVQFVGKYGLDFFEVAPRRLKKMITGHGNADKDLVRLFVDQILGISIDVRHDASDALALAIVCARESGIPKGLRSREL